MALPEEAQTHYTMGAILHDLTATTYFYNIPPGTPYSWITREEHDPLKSDDWENILRYLVRVLTFPNKGKMVKTFIRQPELCETSHLQFAEGHRLSLAALRRKVDLWPPDVGIVVSPSGTRRLARVVCRLRDLKYISILTEEVSSQGIIRPFPGLVLKNALQVRTNAIMSLGSLTAEEPYSSFRQKMDSAAELARIAPARIVMIASRSPHSSQTSWNMLKPCWVKDESEFKILQSMWFSSPESQYGDCLWLFAADGERFTAVPFASLLKRR